MVKKDFIFGKIIINENKPPLVIPEIGINHNGDLELAKKMVYSAYISGAKLIKHQTHIIDDEMSSLAKKVIPGNSKESIHAIMSKSALNESSEYELMKYTESLGLEFLSTPFSRAAADRLNLFGVKAFKIGSGEMNNLPLLKHISNFNKPVIMSTGMNGIEDIKQSVKIFLEKDIPLILLHTTNIYPTQPQHVRLGAMQEMMNTFNNLFIGLSDHTLNSNSCLAATALGAKVLERHFTHDNTINGPDIICSMTPYDLNKLIIDTEEIHKMLGGEKQALDDEKVTIDFAFSTVVTIKDIKKGERFTSDNLWVKRPGVGQIRAKHYEDVLGKKASRDIKNDTHIDWTMVEND